MEGRSFCADTRYNISLTSHLSEDMGTRAHHTRATLVDTIKDTVEGLETIREHLGDITVVLQDQMVLAANNPASEAIRPASEADITTMAQAEDIHSKVLAGQEADMAVAHSHKDKWAAGGEWDSK